MATGGFGSNAIIKGELDTSTDSSTTTPDYVLDRPGVQKTPISALQEMCTKRSMTPEYELLSTEGHVHEPTFVYRVTIQDITAVGQGKSKKVAKHLAAKGILERMVALERHKEFGMGDTVEDAKKFLESLADGSGGGTSPSSRLPGDDASSTAAAAGQQQQQVMSSAVSVTSDDGGEGGPGNPVGKLQERCQQKKWPAPHYEMIRQDGPPHERVFVLNVHLGKFSEEGSARSKKLAKREAAEKMLKKLDSMPAEIQRENIGSTAEEDELAETFLRAMTSLGHKIKAPTSEEKARISAFYAGLKGEHGDCLDALRSIPQSAATEPFDILYRLGHVCQFAVTYIPVEERSSLGDHQCMVQLNSMPVAVCYGRGPTPDEAKHAAAFNALEYLKLMTKNENAPATD